MGFALLAVFALMLLPATLIVLTYIARCVASFKRRGANAAPNPTDPNNRLITPTQDPGQKILINEPQDSPNPTDPNNRLITPAEDPGQKILINEPQDSLSTTDAKQSLRPQLDGSPKTLHRLVKESEHTTQTPRAHNVTSSSSHSITHAINPATALAPHANRLASLSQLATAALLQAPSPQNVLLLSSATASAPLSTTTLQEFTAGASTNAGDETQHTVTTQRVTPPLQQAAAAANDGNNPCDDQAPKSGVANNTTLQEFTAGASTNAGDETQHTATTQGGTPPLQQAAAAANDGNNPCDDQASKGGVANNATGSDSANGGKPLHTEGLTGSDSANGGKHLHTEGLKPSDSANEGKPLHTEGLKPSDSANGGKHLHTEGLKPSDSANGGKPLHTEGLKPSDSANGGNEAETTHQDATLNPHATANRKLFESFGWTPLSPHCESTLEGKEQDPENSQKIAKTAYSLRCLLVSGLRAEDYLCSLDQIRYLIGILNTVSVSTKDRGNRLKQVEKAGISKIFRDQLNSLLPPLPPHKTRPTHEFIQKYLAETVTAEFLIAKCRPVNRLVQEGSLGIHNPLTLASLITSCHRILFSLDVQSKQMVSNIITVGNIIQSETKIGDKKALAPLAVIHLLTTMQRLRDFLVDSYCTWMLYHNSNAKRLQSTVKVSLQVRRLIHWVSLLIRTRGVNLPSYLMANSALANTINFTPESLELLRQSFAPRQFSTVQEILFDDRKGLLPVMVETVVYEKLEGYAGISCRKLLNANRDLIQENRGREGYLQNTLAAMQEAPDKPDVHQQKTHSRVEDALKPLVLKRMVDLLQETLDTAEAGLADTDTDKRSRALARKIGRRTFFTLINCIAAMERYCIPTPVREEHQAAPLITTPNCINTILANCYSVAEITSTDIGIEINAYQKAIKKARRLIAQCLGPTPQQQSQRNGGLIAKSSAMVYQEVQSIMDTLHSLNPEQVVQKQLEELYRTNQTICNLETPLPFGTLCDMKRFVEIASTMCKQTLGSHQVHFQQQSQELESHWAQVGARCQGPEKPLRKTTLQALGNGLKTVRLLAIGVNTA